MISQRKSKHYICTDIFTIASFLLQSFESSLSSYLRTAKARSPHLIYARHTHIIMGKELGKGF